VCLVTDVGHVDDGGFNQFANEGMERAAEELNLRTTVIETQAQTDYAANIDTCISEGYDIIVTVGYALADAMYAAAIEHPDRYFIGADQIVIDAPPNIVGLQFREDQGGFLAGAMAALMTETNVVAGIYGPEEPPILKFRNGFEQGVKFINPDVEVLGVYIDDYNAPDRGAQAAEQFIGDGADVVFGAAGQTGSGGITRAAQSGVKVIGVDLDEYFTTFGGGETPGAENLVMSAIKRVDSGVYDMVKAAVSGEGFPEDSNYILDAAKEGISFTEPHDADVPAEVTERLNEILEGLRNGSIETGVDPVTGVLLAIEVTPEATEASNS
jgi:basic membrane lipoprotein Med (substrate-binding protein (PBP1-ABC) superfamily)